MQLALGIGRPWSAVGTGGHNPIFGCRCYTRCYTGGVDIEAVIAALDTRFDPAEAAIAERMLREYGGSIPDAQLVEEIGLALAIFRRGRR